MKKALKNIPCCLLLVAVCFSLGSCGATSNSEDSKTYSFLVEFYDDSDEPKKVGYAYAAYGQKINSLLPFEGEARYDEKSKQCPTPGKRFKSGFGNIDWHGTYSDIDTSLPIYDKQETNSKVAPAEGEEIDISFIKGNCSLYARFKEEPIQYRAVFHDSISTIEGNDDMPYDYGNIHEWGTFVSLPDKPEKASKYGYKNDYTGFGFHKASSSPFSSLTSAKFYYGNGNPSSLTSFSIDESTTTIYAEPGSFYEDLSAIDENGHYTLDLYGFDGEWTKLGSATSSKLTEVHYYANFSSDYKRTYEVKVFNSYDDYANQSTSISLWGDYLSDIVFDAEYQKITTTNHRSRDNETNLDGSKKIRAWRGYYAKNVIYEDGEGYSLGKEGNAINEAVPEIYAGKPFLNLETENAVMAPCSIFPIYSDCKIDIYDGTAALKETIDIAFGSTISFFDATISVVDAEGNSHSCDLGYTIDECGASYKKGGLNDIVLPSECKKENYRLNLSTNPLINEPVLGDIELRKKTI